MLARKPSSMVPVVLDCFQQLQEEQYKIKTNEFEIVLIVGP